MDLDLNTTAIVMVQPNGPTAKRKIVQVTLEGDGGTSSDDAARSAWKDVSPEVKIIINLLVGSQQPILRPVTLQGTTYDLKLECRPWLYGKRWRFMCGDEEVPSADKWVFTWCPKTSLTNAALDVIKDGGAELVL